MQYNQDPHDHLGALPTRNIDTGLGLNRMAAILQGKESVFETDQFQPLIDLGQELSGRRYGEEHPTDRALRILADHTRGMSFMVADGVVPSNEERGYVLRRVMRRAIQQGRALGMEGGFLVRYARARARADGRRLPRTERSSATAIEKWLAAEEESFGRTLEQGTRLLEELIERALDAGAEGIAAADAFDAARHLRLPLRPDAGTGRRARSRRRRRGLRAADGRPAARARAAAAAGSGAPTGSAGAAGEDPRERARELAAAGRLSDALHRL